MPMSDDRGPLVPNRSAGRPDIGEMVVIHRALTREFRLLPDLVATVDPGDPRRAREMAAHAEVVIAVLHSHHEGEDELLWPLMLERLPLKTGLIETMERQHAVLADLISSVSGHLATWRRTADAETQRVIVDTLVRLRAALDEHLSLEESDLLPLVEDHLTVAEWRAPFEYAQKHTRVKPSAGLVLVGMVLEDANPNERTSFLDQLPTVARLAWSALGARQYRRYTRRVRRNLEVS